MVIDDEDIEIPGYGLTSAAVHIQYRYPVSALLGEVRLNALLRMSRSMVRPTWVQKEVTCSEQQMSKFRLFKKRAQRKNCGTNCQQSCQPTGWFLAGDQNASLKPSWIDLAAPLPTSGFEICTSGVARELPSRGFARLAGCR